MPNFENCTGYTKIKVCKDLEGPPKKYTADHFGAHVNGALDELKTKPVGLDFLTTLHQKLVKQNNQVIIYFSTRRGNQCESGPDQYCALRRSWVDGNPIVSGRELCLALFGRELKSNEVNVGDDEIHAKLVEAAGALFSNPIPTWDPRTFKENPMKLGAAEDYLPHLEKWVKGTEMPVDKKAANVLLAFLYTKERGRKDRKAQGEEVGGKTRKRGAGNSSKVFWLPDNQGPTQFRRPPSIGLAHELCHAYYNNLGDQLGTEGGEEVGAALYEIMATGLGPYFVSARADGTNGWKFCENTFRTAFGVPLRTKYE